MRPYGTPAFVSIGAVLGSTSAAVMTSGGTINTKGAWAQIIASTAEEYSSFWVSGSPPSEFYDGGAGLVDIGIGGAGSEVVLVGNIWMPSVTGLGLNVPLNIPSGSRLACRWQTDDAASRSYSVALIGRKRHEWDDSGWERCVDWGAQTADTSALTLTDPGATHTKGAWTQLVAAAEFHIKQLKVMCGDPGYNGSANPSNFVDIGIGAAGSEDVIIPNLYTGKPGFAHTGIPGYADFPVDIARGTRVAARQQSGQGSVDGRRVDVHVLAFG